jgi:hypothetical protein
VSEAGKEVVQLSFRYTEQEYLAAYRCYVLRAKELLLRVAAFYILLSVGLLLITFVIVDFAFPIWAIVSFGFLLGLSMLYGYFTAHPKRYFQNDPRFRDDFNLTFTDAGIELRSPTVNSSVAWSLYSAVIENDKFYILVYGRRLHFLSIVPKRAFRDSKQEIAFRELLRRHLDHTLKLSPAEREKSEYLPPPFAPPDWR